MLSFLNHYFLVACWGQEWFDYEKDLVEQIAENENMEEQVWGYDGTRSVTFADIVGALRGEPTQGFMDWVEYAHTRTLGMEDTTVVMSSMGCGSSDYLYVRDIVAYRKQYSKES